MISTCNGNEMQDSFYRPQFDDGLYKNNENPNLPYDTPLHRRPNDFSPMTDGPFSTTCRIHGSTNIHEDAYTLEDADKSPTFRPFQHNLPHCSPEVHRTCWCVNFIAEHTRLKEDSTKVLRCTTRRTAAATPSLSPAIQQPTRKSQPLKVWTSAAAASLQAPRPSGLLGQRSRAGRHDFCVSYIGPVPAERGGRFTRSHGHPRKLLVTVMLRVVRGRPAAPCGGVGVAGGGRAPRPPPSGAGRRPHLRAAGRGARPAPPCCRICIPLNCAL
ncbi:hypothetical protein E2C01_029056 [Portunus trituberculatus]|uniref:Uncharacterized protein n=1 Tax=Portunus trituberculatus TaxID=210409 RepID=A0A5B7ER84_PORTR|nr:hypothetical protein [Portunus trituberculatus]